MYEKLTLYYLSGTGNSRRVATWFAETAATLNISTQIGPIESAHPGAELTTSSRHILGLALPAHGFTAPWSMIRFAAHLPNGRGSHAFVVSTRGSVVIGRFRFPGMEGTAAYLVASLLWLRGYCVRGVRGLDMPSNWTALHSGMRVSACDRIVRYTRPIADYFIRRILSGQRQYGSIICLVLGILLLPVSLLYLVMARFWLAKLFLANPHCNGCGSCAENCPRHAMRMWHHTPYWTFRCESCMRCMAYCPRRAVECCHGLAVLQMKLPGVLAGAMAALCVPLATGWPHEILIFACMLPTFWITYKLVYLLSYFRPVNWFVTALTFTRFYRRYHESGTRLVDLKAVGTVPWTTAITPPVAASSIPQMSRPRK